VVWLFALVSDWSWRFDSLWSTDLAASALRPYIGPPGTVISLLRIARWISPLRVQSPCLLVDPHVLHVPLPIDDPPTATVPLIPVILVARLRAAPLPRCCTSSPGPKFTGESKVWWSPVIRFCTRHSCLAREVSNISRSSSLVFTFSRSPSLVSKLTRSPSKSPNSLRRAVTTRILLVGSYLTRHIPPLLRETFKTCSYSPAFSCLS